MEEIINETVETTEIQDIAPDEVVIDDNSIEQPSEETFNPDEIDFGLEYDLSGIDEKYRQDDNFMNALNDEQLRWNELGFTQEQVEYLTSNFTQAYDKIHEASQPRKMSPSEIKDNLNKVLSNEEKRNYRKIVNFAKDKFSGTELEPYVSAIAENPFIVKVINKLMGNTATVPNTPRISRKQSEINIDPIKALKDYQNFITSSEELTPEKRKGWINDYITKAGNAKELKEYFKEFL
jgi:hypothetical protein